MVSCFGEHVKYDSPVMIYFIYYIIKYYWLSLIVLCYFKYLKWRHQIVQTVVSLAIHLYWIMEDLSVPLFPKALISPWNNKLSIYFIYEDNTFVVVHLVSLCYGRNLYMHIVRTRTTWYLTMIPIDTY